MVDGKAEDHKFKDKLVLRTSLLYIKMVFYSGKGKCPNWSTSVKGEHLAPKFIHPLTRPNTQSQLNHSRAARSSARKHPQHFQS